MERLEATVSGKVQGVAYRYFVVEQAELLGLAGTVCNLPDGSVRVVAEGARGKLDELVRRLKDGPPLALVEDISHACVAATGEHEGFSIVRI